MNYLSGNENSNSNSNTETNSNSNSLFSNSNSKSLFSNSNYNTETNSNPLSENNSEGIFSDIQHISSFTWVIIIFTLAIFGINIFIYLAKGTQTVADFFKPITSSFSGVFRRLFSQIIDFSAQGAKTIVGATKNAVVTGGTVINSSLAAVQQATPGGLEPEPKTSATTVKSQPVSSTIPQEDIMRTNVLNKALNTSLQTQNNNQNYEADDSTSNIQKGASKVGWCYIGEDRGFRTCAPVNQNDLCMSGNIFPTQEICVNPKLRP